MLCSFPNQTIHPPSGKFPWKGNLRIQNPAVWAAVDANREPYLGTTNRALCRQVEDDKAPKRPRNTGSYELGKTSPKKREPKNEKSNPYVYTAPRREGLRGRAEETATSMLTGCGGPFHHAHGRDKPFFDPQPRATDVIAVSMHER